MKKLTIFFLLAGLALVASCDSGTDAGVQDTACQDCDVSQVQDSSGTDESEPGDSGVEEDLGPDPYTGPAGAAPDFSSAPEGFFDRPFPSNLDLTSKGRVDLSRFPNPIKSDMIEQYVKLAQTTLKGFSPNTTVYFRFQAPIDTAGFPSVVGSLNSTSAIQLVNVSKTSKAYGQRIPVEVFYWDKEPPKEGYYLEPNLVMVRPLGGFPMVAGDTYACFITRKLKDSEGRYVGQSELVAQALAGEADAGHNELLEPLVRYLNDTTGIGARDISVATVFTTARPSDELAAIADWVINQGTIELVEPPEYLDTKGGLRQFEGAYMAPNFMHGEAPYDSGGEFRFGEDGKPLVHHMERIPFTVGIPEDGECPEGGWPVVEMSHGTGGDRFSFAYDGSGYQLAQKGLATVSIDQPLHGDRYLGPSINVELYSFNFLNPRSGRTLFQQAALDNVALTRILGELEMTDKQGQKHTFDTSRVGYFGHSQGGLTGALFLAVDGGISAGLLSGAGGGLAYTILLRKQIDSGADLDIKEMMAALLGISSADELGLFHPVLTLVQMLVDVSDPVNYGYLYFDAKYIGQPLPIMMTSGIDDPYTPAITAENLAISANIPIVNPVLHPNSGFAIKKLTAVNLPVSNNVDLESGVSVTGALAQFDGYGHFPIFDSDEAIQMYTNFLLSSLVDRVPVIDVD